MIFGKRARVAGHRETLARVDEHFAECDCMGCRGLDDDFYDDDGNAPLAFVERPPFRPFAVLLRGES